MEQYARRLSSLRRPGGLPPAWSLHQVRDPIHMKQQIAGPGRRVIADLFVHEAMERETGALVYPLMLQSFVIARQHAAAFLVKAYTVILVFKRAVCAGRVRRVRLDQAIPRDHGIPEARHLDRP